MNRRLELRAYQCCFRCCFSFCACLFIFIFLFFFQQQKKLFTLLGYKAHSGLPPSCVEHLARRARWYPPYKSTLVCFCFSPPTRACASNPLVSPHHNSPHKPHTCPSSTLQIAALEKHGPGLTAHHDDESGGYPHRPLLQITFNDTFERHVKMEAILDASHQHVHMCLRVPSWP